MIAFHARRPLRFGLLAGALALSAAPGAARAELEYVEFTYAKIERTRATNTSVWIRTAQPHTSARPGDALSALPPAPSAAPVTPSGWDPAKKEAITGKATAGAQAQTDWEFLRQRAARLGKDHSSTWIRVGQLPMPGHRSTDITLKRGVVGETRKPNSGQVAMETLVIQHEGMNAPKAPQEAALDDLPGAPPAPGAIAPTARAPSRAFIPTELRVTKTVPWTPQRRTRTAVTPKAIATK